MSTLGTNQSIHSMLSILVSLSTRAGVQIWDLRNPTQPAKLITLMQSRSSQSHQVEHTGSGASWSPSTGQYFMVAQRITVKYNKNYLTRFHILRNTGRMRITPNHCCPGSKSDLSPSPAMYAVNWRPWDKE